VGVYDSILEESNRLPRPPRPNIWPHGLALYKCFRFSMRFIIKQIAAYLERVKSTTSRVGVYDSILWERNRLPPHPNIFASWVGAVQMLPPFHEIHHQTNVHILIVLIFVSEETTPRNGTFWNERPAYATSISMLHRPQATMHSTSITNWPGKIEIPSVYRFACRIFHCGRPSFSMGILYCIYLTTHPKQPALSYFHLADKLAPGGIRGNRVYKRGIPPNRIPSWCNCPSECTFPSLGKENELSKLLLLLPPRLDNLG
jgi:hypothetical protein